MTSPLQHLDQLIGRRVWILLKTDRELEGDLVGVDEFVNMVLENVTEFNPQQQSPVVPELLLNGNNVVLIVPGGRPSA